MIDQDANGEAPHRDGIKPSPHHDGTGCRPSAPAPFRPHMLGGISFQRITVRFADGHDGVETPDGPTFRPRIEPNPWRRRGRRDRRDAGTWRGAMTRRCDA